MGMKILWWIDHLGPGGSQLVLTRLIEHMSLNGADQSVVCLNDLVDPKLLARIESAGAEVLVVNTRRIKIGVGLITIWRWLRPRQFVVSTTFLFGADVIGTLFNWMMGIPRRISAQRASNRDYSSMRCWLLKGVLRLSTDIVLNSITYRMYSARFCPRNKHVDIIPNGIDVDRYKTTPQRLLLHQELMLDSESYLIGCVGRLAQQKDLGTVIRAVSSLSNAKIILLLVGAGPRFADLSCLADSLGVSSQIRFLGQRNDVDQILANLDIFIQASIFEGMPNSLMEAMASNCPVVATGIDGNRELIGENECGWLFESGNIIQLAKVIETVLTNPEEATHRAALARRRIETAYSEQKMLNSWKSILEGKLESNDNDGQ